MSKHRVAVLKVVAAKSSVTAAAAECGISRQHLHRLLRRYREGGLDDLEPRSRRPHASPQATTGEVRERIVRLRVELVRAGLDAGPATIAWHLGREGQPVPSLSTIRRVLHAAGLVTPEPRKRPRSSWIRFEAAAPNELWQSDFTHWHLADGSEVEIISWLDDHSRFLLGCTGVGRVSGDDVVATFTAAGEAHGFPAATLTDNGAVYTSRFTGGRNGFEYLLAWLGVRKKNGAPGHPQTQGKVERLNQTLKRWLASQPAAMTLAELRAQLDVFADYYNEVRPHRALGGATPATAYTTRAKATPDTRDGHWRIRDDKVGPGGKVTLRRGGKLHHIGLGTQHAGTAVRLLIHDLHIVVIDRETGEILRELTLDPDRDYQPLGRKPGPAPGTPQRGGVTKKTPPTHTKSRDIR